MKEHPNEKKGGKKPCTMKCFYQFKSLVDVMGAFRIVFKNVFVSLLRHENENSLQITFV